LVIGSDINSSETKERGRSDESESVGRLVAAAGSAYAIVGFLDDASRRNESQRHVWMMGWLVESLGEAGVRRNLVPSAKRENRLAYGRKSWEVR
jgi:hypothetical protein